MKQLKTKRKVFLEGMRDGIPIGLGYFAVSFTLGIAMRSAGINWWEGFFFSITNLASAGQYAATQVIAMQGSYIEMAIITLITDARYLLMSCSLSQKFSSETKMKDRLLVGYGITDELFSIAYSRKGYLDPFYSYGAMAVSVLPWGLGTSCGIIMGNVLPSAIVNALSVALYGMFLAIIIPPAKKDKTVLILIISSFFCSYICTVIPGISSFSSGTRIILLTVLIAGIASIVRPIHYEQEDTHEQ